MLTELVTVTTIAVSGSFVALASLRAWDALRVRPDKTIDPEIRGLCDALNSHPAVKTFYSCQGHEWRRWPSVERPYVVFEAPSELTFALQKFLDACIVSERVAELLLDAEGRVVRRIVPVDLGSE